MKSKYRAIKTVVDGITFDSKREATRYSELKLLERVGKIHNLLLQPTYLITINGVRCCEYRADFSWQENGQTVVADAKGFRTPVYKLKRKLMKAVHGIDIREV